MAGTFVDLEVEDLLKVVLALVAVWLTLEIVDLALGMLFGPLKPTVGVVVLLIVVLWFLDYL